MRKVLVGSGSRNSGQSKNHNKGWSVMKMKKNTRFSKNIITAWQWFYSTNTFSSHGYIESVRYQHLIIQTQILWYIRSINIGDFQGNFVVWLQVSIKLIIYRTKHFPELPQHLCISNLYKASKHVKFKLAWLSLHHPSHEV